VVLAGLALPLRLVCHGVPDAGGQFATVLLAPSVWLLVLAQVFFGWATALLYYSSLYYAMDGSDAHGEHGIHEALIGMGICGGPAASAVAQVLTGHADAPAWWSRLHFGGIGMAFRMRSKVLQDQRGSHFPRARSGYSRAHAFGSGTCSGSVPIPSTWATACSPSSATTAAGSSWGALRGHHRHQRRPQVRGPRDPHARRWPASCRT
jgi:hypothetical protein